MPIMRTIYLILYVIAAVCFALAAWGVASRINLLAAGLLAAVAVPLIETARTLE